LPNYQEGFLLLRFSHLCCHCHSSIYILPHSSQLFSPLLSFFPLCVSSAKPTFATFLLPQRVVLLLEVFISAVIIITITLCVPSVLPIAAFFLHLTVSLFQSTTLIQLFL